MLMCFFSFSFFFLNAQTNTHNNFWIYSCIFFIFQFNSNFMQRKTLLFSWLLYYFVYNENIGEDLWCGFFFLNLGAFFALKKKKRGRCIVVTEPVGIHYNNFFCWHAVLFICFYSTNIFFYFFFKLFLFINCLLHCYFLVDLQWAKRLN